jgi:hypothetical protein
MNRVRVAEDNLGIVFADAAEGKLSKQEAEFMLAVDKLTARIASSFKEPASRRELLSQIAHAINERSDALGININLRQLLDVVQIPILHKAMEIRAGYYSNIFRYAKYTFCVGGFICLLWVILTYNIGHLYSIGGPLGSPFVGTVVNITGAVGFTAVGLVIGVGLSVFAANNKLTIDSFDKIQRYDLPVISYFLYLYVLTAAVLILLYFQLLIIGIKTTTLDQVYSQPSLGLIIGLLCGFSESLIVQRLAQVIMPSQGPK